MPTGVLRGLKMDLQLVGGLYGWADDIDLEPGVATLVEIHADDEHDAVGHFNAELASVGAHRGFGNLTATQGRQALGDAAQIVERHRSEGGAGHAANSTKRDGREVVAQDRDEV
jgi:hypothetical protein